MGVALQKWYDSIPVSAVSVAAGATQNVDLDLRAKGYHAAVAQIKVLFGAAPDGATTVKAYASPDNGTTFDTEVFDTIDESIAQGAAATKALTVKLINVPYVRLAITNGNSAEAITLTVNQSAARWVK